MRRFPSLLIASAFVFVPLTGCQNDDSGRVVSGERYQNISDDGRTAKQTEVRVRETPSGATVKETATRQREVVNPPQNGQQPDPTQRDPGKPDDK